MPINNSQESRVSRRLFIQLGTFAAGGLLLPACSSMGRKSNYKSPNEKLNIGIIGTNGKGASDTDGVASENIVALCDVDEGSLRKAAAKYPRAKLYRDYRKMLEEMKEIDGVTVSTPDHHHFPASMMAILLGKHVYCQKPLTHTIGEARAIAKAARKAKVATLMGNQGHSGEGIRAFSELFNAGAIGDVHEVHCWTDRPIWPQGMQSRPAAQPVPDTLDWDLFLGPAPMRPYNKAYHPFAWRGWWDFGCGALGDMACHIMDVSYTALKLTNPVSVEAQSSGASEEAAPNWSIITYHFPARGKMPAVKLVWHDGKKKPSLDLMEETDEKKIPDNGTLYIGQRGKIFTETYGERPRFISGPKDFPTPPKTLPRSPGHYKEWILACKGGEPAGSNFPDYAGPFTEMVLLGNLAVRSGKKIEWDAKNLKSTNAPETASLVHKQYRPGWDFTHGLAKS
ncbi:MAG: putative dehydrogenase [Verrucomicrobiales bacterium]|nr:putative dehydrogenase [Verrucomicrobiales bacterium]